MQLQSGRFAYKNIHDIEQMPIWYLKQILGDTTGDDIRWNGLSTEQQLAVRDEIKRREEFVPGSVPKPTPATAAPVVAGGDVSPEPLPKAVTVKKVKVPKVPKEK